MTLLFTERATRKLIGKGINYTCVWSILYGKILLLVLQYMYLFVKNEINQCMHMLFLACSRTIDQRKAGGFGRCGSQVGSGYGLYY